MRSPPTLPSTPTVSPDTAGRRSRSLATIPSPCASGRPACAPPEELAMAETRSIADPELERYAAEHSSPEAAHLRAAADSTREFSPRHTMMVGGLEGR